MLCFVAPLLAILFAAAPEGPKKLFEAAARALAAGDLAAAESGFQSVLEIQPRHIGALGNLGVVYSKMGRPADAVEVYERALNFAPNEPLLHLNIALAYLKQDDYGSAKPHLKRVLEVQPGNAQAKELLLTTQLHTGEADTALPELERHRNAGKPAILYLLAIGYVKTGDRERANTALHELFTKVSQAEAHFLAGRAYYESTLFEQASVELEQAATMNPHLAGVQRELGKAYVSLRRFDEAKATLTRAVEQDTTDAEAQYFLGAVLVQQDQLEEGTKLLERARMARPNFWGISYYLGKANLESGKVERAVALLNRAAELNPEEASVFYLLAQAERKAGRLDQAKQATAKYLKLEAARRSREQRGSMGAR